MSENSVPGFHSVPKSGVIYVMDRASRCGYDPASHEWANLGRGTPEVGQLDGAPSRIDSVNISDDAQHYAPVLGLTELRQKVADFYNVVYRQGKKSQYTYENVAISGGGRLGLTRIASVLGNCNIGHFIPDYTAYAELLGIFRAFNPIPILGRTDDDFHVSSDELRTEILGRGLGALLLSNPCNPTGQVLRGQELSDWVETARDLSCSMIFDEFYSHFVYDGQMISSAAYVEDVNQDPVIIIDGLTKNWRYPGWRLSWTIGPKSLISEIGSAGSFIDGGANHPFQIRALDLLDPEDTRKETEAIQRLFRQKRDFMIAELRDMGIRIDYESQGTFYIWADLSYLPAPLNEATAFFEAGLTEKFITVPGVFFDVNPGQRRSNTRYHSHCRMSFGPDMDELKKGLVSMRCLIGRYR